MKPASKTTIAIALIGAVSAIVVAWIQGPDRIKAGKASSEDVALVAQPSARPEIPPARTAAPPTNVSPAPGPIRFSSSGQGNVAVLNTGTGEVQVNQGVTEQLLKQWASNYGIYEITLRRQLENAGMTNVTAAREFVESIAIRFKALEKAVSALPDTPENRPLIEEARRALRDGNFRAVEKILALVAIPLPEKSVVDSPATPTNASRQDLAASTPPLVAPVAAQPGESNKPVKPTPPSLLRVF